MFPAYLSDDEMRARVETLDNDRLARIVKTAPSERLVSFAWSEIEMRTAAAGAFHTSD